MDDELLIYLNIRKIPENLPHSIFLEKLQPYVHVSEKILKCHRWKTSQHI